MKTRALLIILLAMHCMSFERLNAGINSGEEDSLDEVCDSPPILIKSGDEQNSHLLFRSDYGDGPAPSPTSATTLMMLMGILSLLSALIVSYHFKKKIR